MDFRDSGHGALSAAPRIALLDAHGWGQARDQIDIRLAHLLDVLPGVRAHRIQEPPLALREKKVKGQRALARAAHPRDDHKFIARHAQGYVLQIVLTRSKDADGVVR